MIEKYWVYFGSAHTKYNESHIKLEKCWVALSLARAKLTKNEFSFLPVAPKMLQSFPGYVCVCFCRDSGLGVCFCGDSGLGPGTRDPQLVQEPGPPTGPVHFGGSRAHPLGLQQTTWKKHIWVRQGLQGP